MQSNAVGDDGADVVNCASADDTFYLMKMCFHNFLHQDEEQCYDMFVIYDI